MGITHIVEDPPNGLVALQHLIGKDTALDIILFCFHSRQSNIGAFGMLLLNGTRAQLIVEVIPRIITIMGIVDTIVICIIERSQIRGQVFSACATGRPVEDNFRQILARIGLLNRGGTSIVEVIHEGENLGLGDDVVFVIIVTNGEVGGCSTIDFQRTRPIIISIRSETEGGNTELVVDIGTTNPQSCAEQRAGVAVLGQVILGNTTVIPHVTIAVNQGTDIVDIQLCRTLGALTGSSFGLDSSALRVGFLALNAFTGGNRR